MQRGPVPGRSGTVILALAILVAPFIAWLVRAEAGLIVMALALASGTLLLRDALDTAPHRIRRWLRLGILVNLALAVACGSLAVWLLVGR